MTDAIDQNPTAQDIPAEQEETYSDEELQEALAEGEAIGDDGEGDLYDTEGVVAPLNTISKEDIEAGADAFDQWLRRNSNDIVTLPRLKSFAGTLPVLGNIMALIDAINDVSVLIDKTPREFTTWVSLGINLFGVIPAPGTAAARMSLRPSLFLVQKEVARQAKLGMGNALGDAIIAALSAHLNEDIAGDIEQFAE